MIFASVDDGRLTLRGHDDTKRVFDLTDDGKASLAETLKEWGVEDGVMCSSSVDFAEEYGAPDDMNVRDWIGEAQRIAAGPPSLLFSLDELEKIRQALIDGKVEKVIEALDGWIAQAHEE